MNKTELTAKISEMSGISAADCEKVLDAFEKVLSEELANSNGVGNAFDKVFKVMSFFKTLKN